MIKAVLFATALWTQVHSWYDAACCDEAHCEPVPCKELIQQEDGTTKFKDMIFKKDMYKASKDGMCHACWNHNSSTPYCIYWPAGS